MNRITLLALFGATAFAQVVIPAGATFRVRTAEFIDVDSTKAGMKFRGTLAQASLQRTLQSRRSQSSLQRVYTVIGSPDRPRPVLRTANPSLAATRRDGSFCPSSI